MHDHLNDAARQEPFGVEWVCFEKLRAFLVRVADGVVRRCAPSQARSLAPPCRCQQFPCARTCDSSTRLLVFCAAAAPLCTRNTTSSRACRKSRVSRRLAPAWRQLYRVDATNANKAEAELINERERGRGFHTHSTHAQRGRHRGAEVLAKSGPGAEHSTARSWILIDFRNGWRQRLGHRPTHGPSFFFCRLCSLLIQRS